MLKGVASDCRTRSHTLAGGNTCTDPKDGGLPNDDPGGDLVSAGEPYRRADAGTVTDGHPRGNRTTGAQRANRNRTREKRGNSPGRRKECWQRHAPNVANRSATPGNQKHSDTATPMAWRISQPRKEAPTRAEEPERTGRGVLEDDVAPQGATAGWRRPRLETWRRERHAQAPRGDESRGARRRRGGYRDAVYATWRTAQVGTPRDRAWRLRR